MINTRANGNIFRVKKSHISLRSVIFRHIVLDKSESIQIFVPTLSLLLVFKIATKSSFSSIIEALKIANLYILKQDLIDTIASIKMATEKTRWVFGVFER